MKMNRKKILLYKRAVTTFSLILTFGLNSIWVQAQDPAPAPAEPQKSPEVLRLEEEKAQAVLRQQIAEARKAELAARFPAGSSTPLAGATTISDNAIIESYMMAYVSMAKAGNRIVASIKEKNRSHNLGIGNIAIYNERDVNLLLAYKVATSQVDALKMQFEDWLKPPPPTSTQGLPPSVTPREALEIGKSFLGGFVDLTAFLRTNVDIKGTSFEIAEGPLVAEIFRAVRRPDGMPAVKLYYPFVFPPDVNPATPSAILDKIEDMRDLRILAAKFISDVAAKDQEIAKVKAKAEQLKGVIDLINAKQREARIRARNILCTYCPGLLIECREQPPNPNSAPPGDPDDQEAFKVLDLIRRVENKECRTIPGERRELLFDMKEILNQTISDKRDNRTKMDQANVALKNLEESRARLASQLTGRNKQATDANNTLRNLHSDRQSPIFEGQIAEVNRVIDNAVVFLKTAGEQFDKFVTSIVQTDATVGVNPLTSYIRAEKLRETMGIPISTAEPGPGYWLQVKVLHAGGNNRIKTNLIVDIFTGGNRVSHSGGTIVQYSLYNSQGQVVASDTITQYINYIKANKVRNLPCLIIDDAAGRQACLDEVKEP